MQWFDSLLDNNWYLPYQDYILILNPLLILRLLNLPPYSGIHIGTARKKAIHYHYVQ